ncbi:hypothetical protein LINPERHAP2_LOCUS28773 [Linum perenne]
MMRERMIPFARLFASLTLINNESVVSGRNHLSSARLVSPSRMHFCRERFNNSGLGKDVSRFGTLASAILLRDSMKRKIIKGLSLMVLGLWEITM